VVAVGVLLAAEGAWSITRERHLSQDSMVYIHAARNVLLGRGVVLDILYYPRRRFPADFDFPQLYTLQPPLYPLAIAGVARLGIDPVVAGLLVPLLACAGIVSPAPRPSGVTADGAGGASGREAGSRSSSCRA